MPTIWCPLKKFIELADDLFELAMFLYMCSFEKHQHNLLCQVFEFFGVNCILENQLMSDFPSQAQ